MLVGAAMTVVGRTRKCRWCPRRMARLITGVTWCDHCDGKPALE